MVSLGVVEVWKVVEVSPEVVVMCLSHGTGLSRSSRSVDS